MNIDSTLSAVPSPTVAEKALRLLKQRRVRYAATWIDADESVIVVTGDTGDRTVTAKSSGVRCDCQAGDNLDPVSCSHKVAAMLAWEATQR